MTWPVAIILYRLVRVEYFIFKSGYYLVEWVGAKQQGRVI